MADDKAYLIAALALGVLVFLGPWLCVKIGDCILSFRRR